MKRHPALQRSSVPLSSPVRSTVQQSATHSAEKIALYKHQSALLEHTFLSFSIYISPTDLHLVAGWRFAAVAAGRAHGHRKFNGSSRKSGVCYAFQPADKRPDWRILAFCSHFIAFWLYTLRSDRNICYTEICDVNMKQNLIAKENENVTWVLV